MKKGTAKGTKGRTSGGKLKKGVRSKSLGNRNGAKKR